MARVTFQYNDQHQHCDEGFQHFKHIKTLGSTLDHLTPQVKGKKEVPLTHKVYSNISPFLGIDIMLISLGATFNDSYVLIKLINYINRFFILAIALLSLIRSSLVSQSTATSQLQCFSLTIQYTFIITTVSKYVRWRDNILTLHKQLEAITLKSDSLNDKECSGRGGGECPSTSGNRCTIRFHLIDISLAWSGAYIFICLTHLYYFTLKVMREDALTSLTYSSVINEIILLSGISINLTNLLYCTFVPFVRHNWIVITCGVYTFFIEHLYLVNSLVLSSIKINRNNHKGHKFCKDANSILLCYYKDSLLSHYEMMRLTRHFNSIFNIFPMMWLVCNLLDFISLLYSSVCVYTLHEKMYMFNVSETLFTHLTNMLSVIIVFFRVTHLQRKSNYLANQVLRDIEVNTSVRDENVDKLKGKLIRKPWWLKYKSTKYSSSERKIKLKEKIQSTNNYKCKLINQLTHYSKFYDQYTFITYMSLIFLFVQLIVAIPFYLYLAFHTF